MLVIEANYSKKLGLPGYSSHQYSITLRAEVSDVSQVSAKSRELHSLMQSCVDREIQQTGYLPGETGKSGSNGHHQGNDNHNGNGQQPSERWHCSDKQRDLILKIIQDHQLNKNQVEQLAQDRFNKTTKALNKLEASGLIEELLEQTGQAKPRNQRFQKAGGR
jgi:hypothetical protein